MGLLAAFSIFAIYLFSWVGHLVLSPDHYQLIAGILKPLRYLLGSLYYAFASVMIIKTIINLKNYNFEGLDGLTHEEYIKTKALSILKELAIAYVLYP